MSCVYVVSDCHFGHKNILKYREGFASIEEHNALIMQNILSKVSKRDTLWMLGDMFFTKEDLYNYGGKLANAVRYTHLILGNHDTDNSSRASNVRDMTDLFTTVRGLYSKHGVN